MLSTSLSTQGAMTKPKAMNSALYGSGSISLGNTAPKTSGLINIGQSSSTPIPLGTTPGLIKSSQPQAPQASSALKKTTTVDAAGNTTTHEYHAPLPPDDPSNKYNTTTGKLNSNYKDPSAPKTGTTSGVMPSTPKPIPTYPGLITELSNQQNSPYNKIATNSATELQKLSANNPATSGPAFDAYQKAIQTQQKLKSDIARSYGNIESEPIPLEFQQGREQVLARQNASLLDAAQQGVNQQQAALGYQIQGLGQQQAGYNQAGGLALTGQGQAQSALNNAAGYTAPSFQGYGSGQYVSPITGTGINGGSGAQIQPNDPFYATLQSYAQQAAQGQYSAIPSSITSNPVLNAQLNQMAKQINPNYNPVTSAAQSGITSDQTATVAQYQSALQQGQNLQAQLSDLISTFGLNPGDINKANQGLQLIARNTSNPHYKQLENYVNDIANTYAQILVPPGGSSTDTSRGIATSMLDATASGTSILDTMRSLDQAAKAKIAGIQTSYGGGGGASGGSTGSSIWNF